MYYFRKCVEGEWREFKLGSEDVAQALTLAIVKCVDVKAMILQVAPAAAKKAGIELGPQDMSEIFQKLAPTYGEIAIDVISKRLAEAKKEASEKASK